MKFLLGVIGAIAAVIYWEVAADAHPTMLQADWISVSIHAALGFVAGWVIGFTFSKLGSS